ncbi:MAG: hypothetical protein EOO46_17105 [Flavobacterium sp.]|nr:MAG: hypothetical protein EOO46_17105 [Flavobacterium sp.]
MKTRVIAFALLFLISNLASGQTIAGYSFSSYPVSGTFKGKKAKIDLESNPNAKSYRTVITETYKKGKVNFAGYYVIAMWGCGTSCSLGVIVDARDGKVYDLPETESNSDNNCQEPCARGQLSSRMYFTSWCHFNVDEDKLNYTVYYWKESKKKFIQITK